MYQDNPICLLHASESNIQPPCERGGANIGGSTNLFFRDFKAVISSSVDMSKVCV